MKILLLTLLAVLISFSSYPSPAQATVLRALSIDDMVEKSDAVFVGKVVSSKSLWSKGANKSGKGRLVTESTIEVIQDVSGTKVGQKLVLRRLGGSKDGVGVRVFGTANLSVGEKALLFTQNRGGHRWVTGMVQGVYRVKKTENGTEVVQTSTDGVSLVRSTKKGLVFQDDHVGQNAHAVTSDKKELSSFVTDLKSRFSRCKSEKRCK